MERPLVSVIIPAFNPSDLIIETITSVRAQSYQPIEIIIVDDGSTDGTRERLAPFAAGNIIRYLWQENQGQAAARSHGFAASRGIYVSFIDADDLIAPNKISLQVEFLESHLDCGVCYSDIAHFWHEYPLVLLHKKLVYYEGHIFDKLIRENFIQVMTALIRRDQLKRCGMPGPEFRRSDDWYLWLLLSYGGTKFCFMNKILSFQRRQTKGTLSDQRAYFKQTAETNISIYREFSKKISSQDLEKYDIVRLVRFWEFRSVVGSVILGDRVSAQKALRAIHPVGTTEAVKKLFLWLLVSLVPISFFGSIILKLREMRKRWSFEIIRDPAVHLPLSGTRQ